MSRPKCGLVASWLLAVAVAGCGGPAAPVPSTLQDNPFKGPDDKGHALFDYAVA